jgi:tetratricopeptide (TPR) repeat protein
LYATLWGDGLMGGRGAVWQRPPWNYRPMTMGYSLALGPSLLLLTGVITRASSWARKPTIPWLLLGGTAAIYGLALARMALLLPSYAQAKAFFALAALLPFCAFIVEGFDFCARRARGVAAVLAAVCAIWFVNNYAAFWILPNAPQTQLLPAIAEFYDPSGALPPGWAEATLKKAAQRQGTGRSIAIETLMSAALRAGQTNRAAAMALEAARNGSANGWILSQADAALTRSGQWDEALNLTERAAHDAPDDAGIARTWLELAQAARRDELTTQAGAWLFRDDPANAPAHAVMAEALTRLGRTNEAALHRTLAEDLR